MLISYNPLSAILFAIVLSGRGICSKFKFNDLMEEFKWTQSSESLALFSNPKIKFPSRSFERSTFKLSEDDNEKENFDVAEKFTWKLPEYNYYLLLQKDNYKSKEKNKCIFFKAKPMKWPESHTDNNQNGEKYFILTPKLSNLLMQIIFDYFEAEELLQFSAILPELTELIDSVIDNRILRSFPNVLDKNVNVTGHQIDSLSTAAQILNHVYPLLNLKNIKSLQDLSALLIFSWLISNDSKKLIINRSALELVKFIISLSDSFPFLEDIVSSENRIFFENRIDFFKKLLKIAFYQDCKATIALIFHSNCINEPLILGSNAYWQILKNYTAEKKFKLMFDKVYQEENVSSDKILKMNLLRILEVTDNAVLLKTFLSHKICTIDEDFIKGLSKAIFRSCLRNIFEELIVNPFTLPFLNANPKLLALPENSYFAPEKQKGLFLEKYISTLYFSQSPGFDTYILRSISDGNFMIFRIFLNSSNPAVLLPEQFTQMFLIIDQILKDRYFWINEFWTSPKVYSFFIKLPQEERTRILTQIIESRDYYHLVVLSRSSFDYFGATNIKNLVNIRKDLILSDDFFDFIDVPNSSQWVLCYYTESDSFILHPEMHSRYILRSIETRNFAFLHFLFESKNTQIHLDKSLALQLITILNESRDYRAPRSFWNNESVQEYFSKAPEELKAIFMDRKECYISHIIAMLNVESFNYFALSSFDIIDYCLNAPISVTEIRKIWMHENFKTKLPELYEKYRNDLSFIIKINGRAEPPEIVTNDLDTVSSSDSESDFESESDSDSDSDSESESESDFESD